MNGLCKGRRPLPLIRCSKIYKQRFIESLASNFSKHVLFAIIKIYEKNKNLGHQSAAYNMQSKGFLFRDRHGVTDACRCNALCRKASSDKAKVLYAY